ncbi:electron transport complex subunit RsxB [Achromobacter insolitus]|jgi:electron transport complex protein RnfB|uniref:electron transport complex subunit RsxB n=1 Tax=Achromobacter TaxID=222 RepID=UPI0007C7217E|nr:MULTISPECIES: electron transport complex subunit RsxB [Achromobacter]MDH3066164.1 electron transport complex subunit RsxB [Achromobacter insolitus]MEB3096099.1 electron transport complex subunit RsxB [Achromobacter sp. D10]NGT13853.1 electron transport complex subunit RsxB [Achromobacter insolitus]OAE65179.1 ferredoxin [Achromobacter insolitus]OCZ56830.1 ferredoxin [Achromobacter insolitus]
MSCRSLADRIDALLPQTQCTKCGYDGCRPYADAIADGAAPINRCPPGGDEGIAALSALLDVPALPLDTTRGEPGPLLVARIDEAHCIGCTLCIQACPVDAIVGANKHMHTVLADWCTGCDLCVAPCPVDCIQMVPAGRAWGPHDATVSRQRHRSHLARTERLAADNARLMAPEAAAPSNATTPAPAADDTRNEDRKRSAIESALARARARRNPTQS